MKKIIILSLGFLLTSISYAHSNFNTEAKEIGNIFFNEESKTTSYYNTDKLIILNPKTHDDTLGKCAITINITLDDGTKIEGKVTFDDVNLLECAVLKFLNFWSKIF
jgi:hypothetical protein